MRRKNFIVSLIFVVVCLFGFSVSAFANVPLMPIEDIRPGMKGIAKTVIKGDTIETFDVEVLGVTGNEFSGHSILIKASGDLIERSGGIASGMSGSPVYINGRLAGAVAFGKLFNDPHYCFLTPIGRMLDLLNDNIARPSSLIPKNTPLMTDGFSVDGIRYLNEKLAPYELEAVPVGGSANGKSTKPLEPGSAVGVSLIRGDIRLGALGTVTWVGDDGKILAFGHPFMQRGSSKFFMDRVWIIASLPNLQSAYKVGNLGETIGTVTEDRSAGIAGVIGKEPKVIPMYVAVSDGDRSINGSARVEIIDDEILFPAMVDAVAYNTVTKVIDRAGGGTAKVDFVISGKTEKGEMLKVERSNMYYVSNGISQVVNKELAEAAHLIAANKFEKVNVYGVNVNMDLTSKPEVAEISRAKCDAKKAKPGDEIIVDVELRPYRAEKIYEQIKFRVPEDRQEGSMQLVVRGGGSLAWLQNGMGKQEENENTSNTMEQTKHKTLEDFVKDINEADCNNDLVVDLVDASVNLSSVESLTSAMKGSPHKKKKSMDFIVDGNVEITVEIIK